MPGSINISTGKINDVAETVLPDKGEKIIGYCANEDYTTSPGQLKNLCRWAIQIFMILKIASGYVSKKGSIWKKKKP